MQVEYDPQANAVYVQLRSGEVDDTIEVGRYLFVDVDEEGVPLGLEILFADKMLGQADLASITLHIARPAATADSSS